MTYGETIRTAREGKQLTLRSLARTLGVSAPWLSGVEHDRQHLSPQHEAQLCEALGLDPVVLDASKGYSRELAGWIKDNPELVKLLRELRRSGQPLRIGGENCPCRKLTEDT